MSAAQDGAGLVVVEVGVVEMDRALLTNSSSSGMLLAQDDSATRHIPHQPSHHSDSLAAALRRGHLLEYRLETLLELTAHLSACNTRAGAVRARTCAHTHT